MQEAASLMPSTRTPGQDLTKEESGADACDHAEGSPKHDAEGKQPSQKSRFHGHETSKQADPERRADRLTAARAGGWGKWGVTAKTTALPLGRRQTFWT